MIYVYSTPNGAGRAMSYEEIAEPWPMLLVAVFEEDQEEEAGQLLHWLGGQPSVAWGLPVGLLRPEAPPSLRPQSARSGSQAEPAVVSSP